MIIESTTEGFKQNLKNTTVTIVDFYAPWCSPCQQIIRILPRLNTELNDRVNILKVNIDEHPELKSEFEVTKIPIFIIFKDSQELYRFVGVTPLATLKGTVESLL